MNTNNPIQIKSYAFALKAIHCYKQLYQERKEWVLSKQFLRAGTSIGANIEEAIGGQSRKDFIAKLSIAYKEAREAKYWLRLLRDSDYLSSADASSFLQDCEELLRLLGSILRTSRNS